VTLEHSELELRQIVEAAVVASIGRPLPGLRFVVDRVVVCEGASERLVVHSTLHFHDKGSPYCCGEPGCQLGARLFCRDGKAANHIRRSLNAQLEIEFEDVAVAYHPGTTCVLNGRVRPLGRL